MAVLMIVWVMTDFEMTFRGDLFKITWQKNDCFQRFQYKKKKLATVLSNIQVSNPGSSWPSCLVCTQTQQMLDQFCSYYKYRHGIYINPLPDNKF